MDSFNSVHQNTLAFFADRYYAHHYYSRVRHNVAMKLLLVSLRSFEELFDADWHTKIHIAKQPCRLRTHTYRHTKTHKITEGK